jgi:hypothetical protein
MLLEINDFNVGDIYTIENLEGSIQIIKIDYDDFVIHFSYIENKRIKIYHVPITFSMFLSSIKFKKDVKKVSRNQKEAYSIWKNENGGVWNIELNEIITNILNI